MLALVISTPTGDTEVEYSFISWGSKPLRKQTATALIIEKKGECRPTNVLGRRHKDAEKARV